MTDLLLECIALLSTDGINSKAQVYFNHSLDKSQTKEALADYGCVEIDEAIELPQVIIEMIKDGVVC